MRQLNKTIAIHKIVQVKRSQTIYVDKLLAFLTTYPPLLVNIYRIVASSNVHY